MKKKQQVKSLKKSNLPDDAKARVATSGAGKSAKRETKPKQQ